ncbi:hypothetical protein [Bradyrhizobium sp. TM233]|uniref:hypothetical protein n=1 Tax=Bradyrhizobium sp. TM233 TaxID=2599801 RepID=UPI0030C6B3F3
MESSGTSHDERVFAKLVVVVKFGACVTGCISGVMARDMDFEVDGAVEVTIACIKVFRSWLLLRMQPTLFINRLGITYRPEASENTDRDSLHAFLDLRFHRHVISGMDDDPLDAMNKLQRLAVFTRDCLQRPAPAPIQNCGGSCDACMSGSIFVTRDLHESLHGDAGMCPCQGFDFGQRPLLHRSASGRSRESVLGKQVGIHYVSHLENSFKLPMSIQDRDAKNPRRQYPSRAQNKFISMMLFCQCFARRAKEDLERRTPLRISLHS